MKNKKLSIIVPVYNGEKHFKNNFEMWKELVKRYDCFFVEDNLTKASEETVKKLGGKYYCKENGQWGSVINYIRTIHSSIKTPYITIFDQDDIFDLDELENTVYQFKNSDIYITNYKKIGSINILHNYDIDSLHLPFIHALYFRVDLLLRTNELIEDLCFTDEELRANLFAFAKSSEKIETLPYMHVYGVHDQSTSGDISNTEEYYSSISKIVLNTYNLVLGSTSNVLKSTFLTKLEWLSVNNSNNKKYLKMYKELYKVTKVNIFRSTPFVRVLATFKKKRFNI